MHICLECEINLTQKIIYKRISSNYEKYCSNCGKHIDINHEHIEIIHDYKEDLSQTYQYVCNKCTVTINNFFDFIFLKYWDI